MTPELLMHINELTLLIQRSGPGGIATKPTTTFTPLAPLPEVTDSSRDYRSSYRPRLLERMFGGRS